jgi:hypothetical protein
MNDSVPDANDSGKPGSAIAGNRRAEAAKGQAAQRPARAAGLVAGLSRSVTLFGERAPDVFAGVDHVIRLGLAGGMAAIVAEAGAFEELSELARLGRQSG